MTPKKTGKGRLVGVAMSAFALIVLFTGCASYPTTELTDPEFTQPENALYLAAGDELEISFLGAPEMNTTQKVRRDGRISLKLLGELVVAGKTPELVQKELLKLYAPQLQNKEITLVVRSPGPVFVGGAVGGMGASARGGNRIDMDHPLTVLEAIMMAGGFNSYQAEVRSVIVIRHTKGQRKGYALNLQPALEGKEGSAFYLRPFDIVYVPRTMVVKVDQWIDQYINEILPDLGIGYSSDGEVTVYR